MSSNICTEHLKPAFLLRVTLVASLGTGCVHERTDLHDVEPVKLRRIKDGGLSPVSTRILVDFASGSVKYDWYRQDGQHCMGESTIETSQIIPILHRIKLCRDQVKILDSDGVSDFLGVDWAGSPGEPQTSMMIHARKNPAIAGEQIFACIGLHELDRTLESLLPCS